MRKQIQLSPNTLKKIAEALFLAYTAEQAAYLGGVSERTLFRIRKTPIWQEIERQALAMEKPYRQKVWKGAYGWQGAAWMLERKYPGQFAKPEIQLSLNTSATTNNTIVITAEQASSLRAKNATVNEALSKLVPPSERNRLSPLPERLSALDSDLQTSDNQGQTLNKQGSLFNVRDSARGLDNSNASDFESKTSEDGVVEESPPASPTGTPDVGARHREPNLPPNSKSVENSRNLNSSSNNKVSKEITLKRKPGRPKKNA